MGWIEDYIAKADYARSPEGRAKTKEEYPYPWEMSGSDQALMAAGVLPVGKVLKPLTKVAGMAKKAGFGKNISKYIDNMIGKSKGLEKKQWQKTAESITNNNKLSTKDMNPLDKIKFNKQQAQLRREHYSAGRKHNILNDASNAARVGTAGAVTGGAVAGDIIFNRGGREDLNTTNADGITNAPPVVVDNNGTVVAPNNSPFPFPMTPGSRPDFSDQMGNLQATPYQDAMAFSGDRVNEARAEGGRVSDAELIANIVSQHSAEQGVGQNVPQRFAPQAAPAMEQLAAAIAAVDKPQAVTNVQKTISSDPGYKDGYKIDNEPKAKPAPQRAATADPLNLFGQRNGYNPFSNKERIANGQKKLSFTDFFKSNVGTR